MQYVTLKCPKGWLKNILKNKIQFQSKVGGLRGITYALHLQLVGKPVVNLLFVIIELFSLSFTYG